MINYLVTRCSTVLTTYRPEYKMLQYQPSVICASAVYLALKTHGQTPWVRTHRAAPSALQHASTLASLPFLLPSLPPPPNAMWCGRGTDCRAPEAFDLHGGRPPGLYCTLRMEYTLCNLYNALLTMNMHMHTATSTTY